MMFEYLIYTQHYERKLLFCIMMNHKSHDEINKINTVFYESVSVSIHWSSF